MAVSSLITILCSVFGGIALLVGMGVCIHFYVKNRRKRLIADRAAAILASTSGDLSVSNKIINPSSCSNHRIINDEILVSSHECLVNESLSTEISDAPSLTRREFGPLPNSSLDSSSSSSLSTSTSSSSLRRSSNCSLQSLPPSYENVLDAHLFQFQHIDSLTPPTLLPFNDITHNNINPTMPHVSLPPSMIPIIQERVNDIYTPSCPSSTDLPKATTTDVSISELKLPSGSGEEFISTPPDVATPIHVERDSSLNQRLTSLTGDQLLLYLLSQNVISSKEYLGEIRRKERIEIIKKRLADNIEMDGSTITNENRVRYLILLDKLEATLDSEVIKI